MLPSLPWCVGRVRSELDAALARHGVRGPLREDIALVVTEAATNVVLHAYGVDAPGPLYATARLSRGTLDVTVCDCGRGHAARRASPGRGVRHTVDDDALGRPRDRHGSGARHLRARHLPRGGGRRPGAPGATRPRAHSSAATRCASTCAVVRAASAALREDTQALTAQAKLLIARGEQLAAERRRRG